MGIWAETVIPVLISLNRYNIYVFSSFEDHMYPINISAHEYSQEQRSRGGPSSPKILGDTACPRFGTAAPLT